MSDKKQQNRISRRNFLKGTSAGIAAGATTVAIGFPQLVSAQESTGGNAWENPPEAIPDSQIVETIDAEVVVVGAGVSGLAAACRAKENGANVVVLEKGATWSGRGGGLGVFTSRIMREQGIELNKEEVAREWIEQCGNRSKEELVWLFLNESGNALDWWLDKAEPMGVVGMIWGGYYRGSTYTEYPAYHMFFNGPAAAAGMDPGAELAAVLYEENVNLEVPFYFRAPAEQLIKEGDRVVAVIASTEDGYKRFNASKGVILATGDISGNYEMCEAYSPIVNKAVKSDYTPIGQNTGDGHMMGMWAGGRMQDTPLPAVVHPQAFAWFHPGCYPFINVRGKRFMNEDTWVQAESLQCIMQPDHPWAYTILDANWPEGLTQSLENGGGGMFWDSFRAYGSEVSTATDYFKAVVQAYLEAGEWAWKADSLEELAEMIEVPADQLVASIERYNELVDGGQDLDFGKTASQFTAKVAEPPYYALKFGPAVLVTVGGLDVDTTLHVLDANQNPIPGLFAVGNVSGSIYGTDYPIQVPGNSHARALAWGYLAGKNVLEEA